MWPKMMCPTNVQLLHTLRVKMQGNTGKNRTTRFLPGEFRPRNGNFQFGVNLTQIFRPKLMLFGGIFAENSRRDLEKKNPGVKMAPRSLPESPTGTMLTPSSVHCQHINPQQNISWAAGGNICRWFTLPGVETREATVWCVVMKRK